MNDDDDEVAMFDNIDALLATLKRDRRDMLLAAIGVLHTVSDQRTMEAPLEVLYAALADLDAWGKRMAAMIEHSMALSFYEPLTDRPGETWQH